MESPIDSTTNLVSCISDHISTSPRPTMSSLSSESSSIRHFVEETVSRHQITVFSRSKCSDCRISKEAFSSPSFQGVDVEFFDLDAIDPLDASRIRKEVFKMSGQRQLPLILVNSDYGESSGNDHTKKKSLRYALGQRLNPFRRNCPISPL